MLQTSLVYLSKLAGVDGSSFDSLTKSPIQRTSSFLLKRDSSRPIPVKRSSTDSFLDAKKGSRKVSRIKMLDFDEAAVLDQSLKTQEDNIKLEKERKLQEKAKELEAKKAMREQELEQKRQKRVKVDEERRAKQELKEQKESERKRQKESQEERICCLN